MIDIKEKDIFICNMFFACKMEGYGSESKWSERYIIPNDIENIAAFIAGDECNNYVITTSNDEFVMSTLGGFVDKIYDQEYLKELLEVLIPMQLGEVEVPDFKCCRELSYLSESTQGMSM